MQPFERIDSKGLKFRKSLQHGLGEKQESKILL